MVKVGEVHPKYIYSRDLGEISKSLDTFFAELSRRKIEDRIGEDERMSKNLKRHYEREIQEEKDEDLKKSKETRLREHLEEGQRKEEYRQKNRERGLFTERVMTNHAAMVAPARKLIEEIVATTGANPRAILAQMTRNSQRIKELLADSIRSYNEATRLYDLDPEQPRGQLTPNQRESLKLSFDDQKYQMYQFIGGSNNELEIIYPQGGLSPVAVVRTFSQILTAFAESQDERLRRYAIDAREIAPKGLHYFGEGLEKGCLIGDEVGECCGKHATGGFIAVRKAGRSLGDNGENLEIIVTEHAEELIEGRVRNSRIILPGTIGKREPWENNRTENTIYAGEEAIHEYQRIKSVLSYRSPYEGLLPELKR